MSAYLQNEIEALMAADAECGSMVSPLGIAHHLIDAWSEQDGLHEDRSSLHGDALTLIIAGT
ncbi:MAG: hypothetical protein Q9203_002109 [Teloschistes exilis]